MILTPIDMAVLPDLLSAMARALMPYPVAHRVFAHIAASRFAMRRDPVLCHADGVALCRSFAMPILDVSPEAGFSWDGHRVAIRTEASVLIHEVAHYQLAAPSRRFLPDFGLGAGPETGQRDRADAALKLSGVGRDIEEGLCSLLGILWEVHLGHDGLPAFIEQNWLEGGAREANIDHFVKMTGILARNGFIDANGVPQILVRMVEDEECLSNLDGFF